MNRVLATKLTTQKLNGTVGDNFINVHAKRYQWYMNKGAVIANSLYLLGLSTRTGLPDDKREVVQESTINDLFPRCEIP